MVAGILTEAKMTLFSRWFALARPGVGFGSLSASLPPVIAAAHIVVATVLFLALGLWASTARAGSADLSWTLPTTNVDGTPIAATGVEALIHTRVEWGTCAGTAFGTVTGSANIAVPARTHTVLALAPQTWCFRAIAVTASAESAPSAVVSKVIIPAVPRPPTALTVSVLTAYSVVKRTDRFVMVPVGTVPGGTVCDSTQSVNGYYVVPRTAVTWSGTVKPAVVVASCA